MPFCPKCRYEYRPGITACPDCGSKLVDVLPPEDDKAESGKQTEYDDWLELARLTSSEYAEMIVEGFRAKEIPVIALSKSGHFGITGQMGVSSFRPIGGAYTILVPREFAADASEEGRMILGDIWDANLLVDIKREL